MVIQNRNHTYVAIQKLDSAEPDQFLCRKMENGRSRGCRIAVLENRHAPEIIAYLENQTQNDRFRDLEEYFTDDKFLYIVTSSAEQPGLEEKLTGQKCSLSERLTIGRGLLESLLLQGFDDYFCCAVLQLGGISVSAALEVSFQYDLSGILDHGQYHFAQTQARLAEILGFIFREEEKQESFPEMSQLLGRLRQGKFSSLVEVYGQFLPVASRWMGRDEAELTPKSFWFRVWERVKKLGKALLWLGKAALLLAAVAYLAVSVAALIRQPAQADVFTEIGTLMIQ